MDPTVVEAVPIIGVDHAVVFDGDVLLAVRERLASEFRITHVTLQLEAAGCGDREAHV